MSERDEEKQAEAGASIDQVKGRLDEIKKSHRGRIRWRISKHTAEMAIAALENDGRAQPRKSGKSRRRKRKKRLL